MPDADGAPPAPDSPYPASPHPDSLRIVVVGEGHAASRTVQRVKAFRALGHRVRVVSTTREGQSYETRPALLDRIRYRLRIPADPAGANRALLAALAEEPAEVLWLDNARTIRPGTLRRALAAPPSAGIPRPRLLWYCEDDMLNPRHRTRWIEAALPLFDLWVTTKSLNCRPQELPTLGVRRMLFVNNAFDPDIHRPVSISEADRARLGSPVTFVGTCEEPRARSLLRLAEAGVPVRVWGNGWGAWAGRHPDLRIEGRPAYNDEYAAVIAASAINLCFLRKFNRDLQTCRSIELPACGAFMLHERNAEMTALFAEDREAAYFDGDEELVAACCRWLADAPGRRRVAAAALARARAAGLTHQDMLRRALGTAFAEDAAKQ